MGKCSTISGEKNWREVMNMEKYNIMVVDDVPSICTAVVTALRTDYKVFPFTSGQDALDHLNKNPIDLVLLDYEMPKMTGYEVLLAIRTNRSTKDTPVVFLTSETNDRMKKEMLSRGATDYLCKPINHQELRDCIKKHLR